MQLLFSLLAISATASASAPAYAPHLGGHAQALKLVAAAGESAARIAAGGAPLGSNPNDPFAGSGCNCSTFCDGSCAINATGPANVTFYRMTPPDVLSLDDKNTGDLAGDDSFILQRRALAGSCLADPSNPICRTVITNSSGENSTDVIMELNIEVDGAWGPYLYCNPVDAKHPQGAWACSVAVTNVSAPPDFPQGACSDAYAGYDSLCFMDGDGSAISVPDVDMAGCCAEAKKHTSLFFKDGAPMWSYTRSNRSCLVFPRGTRDQNFGNSDCVGAVQKKLIPPSPAPCDCDRVHRSVGRQDLVAHYGKQGKEMFPAGGVWFSHPAAGECKAGQRIGDGSGCTWRVVRTAQKVAAQCVYEQVDKAMEAIDPSCFASCPGGVRNVTSSCYLECYAKVAYGASQQQLTAPWKAAFGGGCPPV